LDFDGLTCNAEGDAEIQRIGFEFTF